MLPVGFLLSFQLSTHKPTPGLNMPCLLFAPSTSYQFSREGEVIYTIRFFRKFFFSLSSQFFVLTALIPSKHIQAYVCWSDPNQMSATNGKSSLPGLASTPHYPAFFSSPTNPRHIFFKLSTSQITTNRLWTRLKPAAHCD